MTWSFYMYILNWCLHIIGIMRAATKRWKSWYQGLKFMVVQLIMWRVVLIRWIMVINWHLGLTSVYCPFTLLGMLFNPSLSFCHASLLFSLLCSFSPFSTFLYQMVGLYTVWIATEWISLLFFKIYWLCIFNFFHQPYKRPYKLLCDKQRGRRSCCFHRRHTG